MAVARRSPFVALEVTGRCQLRCIRCYAGSGPEGLAGRIETGDWMWVIDDAARQGTHPASADHHVSAPATIGSVAGFCV